MDSGLYAACAGLMARTQQLDTIASNMANTTTAGFQGQRNVFGSVLAQAGHRDLLSAMNQVTNSYGVLSGTELDQSQGAMTKTGNPLDLALEGSGYLKVQTATGIAYTRGGNLQLSSTGQLETPLGDAVLGETGPMILGKGPLTISADGTVSVSGATAGRLKVVSFPSSSHILSRGSGYYSAPADQEQASETKVRQGSLESSNVSPVTGVVELITAQRSAETMRHVLSMLDSEMDKTAAQDLPRIG